MPKCGYCKDWKDDSWVCVDCRGCVSCCWCDPCPMQVKLSRQEEENGEQHDKIGDCEIN